MKVVLTLEVLEPAGLVELAENGQIEITARNLSKDMISHVQVKKIELEP